DKLGRAKAVFGQIEQRSMADVFRAEQRLDERYEHTLAAVRWAGKYERLLERRVGDKEVPCHLKHSWHNVHAHALDQKPLNRRTPRQWVVTGTELDIRKMLGTARPKHPVR